MPRRGRGRLNTMPPQHSAAITAISVEADIPLAHQQTPLPPSASCADAVARRDAVDASLCIDSRVADQPPAARAPHLRR